MVIFPYPTNNLTNVVDFIRYVNSTVVIGDTGILGGMMLFTMGAVAFLTTKAYSSDRAFAFAAFLTFVMGIFFRFMNLINDTIFAFTIILLIAGILVLMRERDVEAFGV